MTAAIWLECPSGVPSSTLAMETDKLKQIRTSLEEKRFFVDKPNDWDKLGIDKASQEQPLQSSNRLKFRFRQIIRLVATDKKAQRNLSDAEEKVLAEWFRILRDAMQTVSNWISTAPRALQHDDDKNRL